MTNPVLPSDPLWPRAGHWIVPADHADVPESDLALLGVPASRTSISPTSAHATPGAVRDALLRYSTYSTAHDVDVAVLSAVDMGDVVDPDGPEGEARVATVLDGALDRHRLLVTVGGDNSITYSVMRGLFEGGGVPLADCGLVTVDAHHDLRDGASNGSPVRRLIDEGGLLGSSVVQIGIADFANSAPYARRARDSRITVVPRSALRGADLARVAADALAIAGAGGRPVYVDLDVDVCDRAEVPACPAAAPGGITADELRQLAFAFARNPRVRAIDIAEIDATIDAHDQRTVRLAALLVLEAAAGLALRAR